MASDYQFDSPVPPAAEVAGPPDLVFTCTGEPPARLDWQHAERIDAQGRRADGDPDFDFVRFDSHDAVRITGALDFHVYDDRIHCHVLDERHRYLIEIALLGMVFSLWLERRGTATLHAAVTVMDGAAVGFLGVKGGGKTTTATACLAAGHAFLADDLLAVREHDGRLAVEGGVPSLRLWPEQIERFVGDPTPFPLVHPDFPKRRVDLPGRFGRFADGAAPLGRLYLPQRWERDDIVIERLPAPDAMIELIRHSFLPREVQRFGWQAGRLQVFARMIAAVPVLRLRYPSGYDRLPDVVRTIEDDASIS